MNDKNTIMGYISYLKWFKGVYTGATVGLERVVIGPDHELGKTGICFRTC